MLSKTQVRYLKLNGAVSKGQPFFYPIIIDLIITKLLSGCQLNKIMYIKTKFHFKRF
jgi:hypothetical protein